MLFLIKQIRPRLDSQGRNWSRQAVNDAGLVTIVAIVYPSAPLVVPRRDQDGEDGQHGEAAEQCTELDHGLTDRPDQPTANGGQNRGNHLARRAYQRRRKPYHQGRQRLDELMETGHGPMLESVMDAFLRKSNSFFILKRRPQGRPLESFES